MSSRLIRLKLIGAVAATLMLISAPAALAIDIDPPEPPTVSGHQIVNDSSGLALTAGSTGNLYLSARSDTNKAQQFKRKTITASYIYRYESLKYPGQCVGVNLVGQYPHQYGTPHLRPCSSSTTQWHFYNPYPDPSRGLFYLEYPVANDNALHPSGTSVVLGNSNWNTVGASAHWHDRTIAID
jgi:hypothetical protein